MNKHEWILRCAENDDEWSFSGLRTLANLSEFERWLYDNRERVEVVLEGSLADPHSYGYDYVAVVRCDGVYGLATTSGCSCPSPSETWDIAKCEPEAMESALMTHGYPEFEEPEVKERRAKIIEEWRAHRKGHA